MNDIDKEFWIINKKNYDVIEINKQAALIEQEYAFKLFREAIKPWREIDNSCYAALGGDSDCGGWSVVYENELWVVFVGERGVRYQPSFFTNVWDALNFVGIQITNRIDLNAKFYLSRPDINDFIE